LKNASNSTISQSRAKRVTDSTELPSSPYFSPKELASRWRCSRSSIDRIARRARLTRVFLGEGKNGIVRYLAKEVMDYEASRQSMTQSFSEKN